MFCAKERVGALKLWLKFNKSLAPTKSLVFIFIEPWQHQVVRAKKCLV